MPSAIPGIAGYSGAPPSTETPHGSNKLGKDEFLKLLVTQLANQDPLSPADNQAFIAQLAQFASVEQAEATNRQLEQLLVAQASSNQNSVANLVGKDVTYRSNSVTLSSDGTASVSGLLKADAKQVNAIISDSNGRVVRSISLTNVTAGPVTLNWDGHDESGAKLPPGNYTVKLTAADATDQSVDFEAQGRARATGVSFQAGFPELLVNGVRVRLSDVVEIHEPSPTQRS